jgi:pimeloyl-ACP methyl ester carboxylesterase
MADPPLHRFPGRDGTDLVYRELGDGRPLVLLHGYMGNAAMWTRAGLADALAEAGHRLIMPDTRGHGQSATPHDPVAYPPDVMADDGLALIDHLELDDYDLGGYSLGGRTVMRLLARGAAPRRAVVGGQGLEAIRHTVGRGDRYRHLLTNLGTFAPGSRERAMEDWITSGGCDPTALLLILDTFVDTPAEAIEKIEVPTLVMTGAGDGHDETAGALAAALPVGRYLQVPGDHGTALGAPEFLAALLDFLA